jgi:Flp pilus assembly protein TadB
MSEITKSGRDFVGYDYQEINVEQSKASLLIDGYLSFGWILDENIQPSKVLGKVSIKFKRDRKISNKAELTRLQRHFEACMSEIDAMEKSKTQSAKMWSIIVGILGTAFMAGSTFAVTAHPPQIILCVILAVPGFIGWLLPLFLFRRMTRRNTERMTPMIEKKYDEIHEICEKGNGLLA